VTRHEEQETAYIAQGFKKTFKTSRPTSKPFDKHRPQGKWNEKECFYCHKKGHIKAECRKRIADKKVAGNERGMALMAFNHLEGDDKQLWALDSGSTKHLSPYKELFNNLRGLDEDIYHRHISPSATRPRRRHKALETSS